MRTHYDNLQVQEGAGPEVIKASYKALANKWHPDKNPEKLEEATRVFRIITTAYEVLSNAESRAKYDAWLLEQRRSSTPTPGAHFGSPQSAKPERPPYDAHGNTWTPPKSDPARSGTNGGAHHRPPPQGKAHPPEQGFNPLRGLVVVALVTAWFLVFGKQWTIETLIDHLFSK
ncbi:J domain-containing protein [Pseudomonas sp. NPDC089569]|uniref:J domain-containing protein n=1 Tax=Pseudomonas sp. NPDC089569 TaxID=3390722 RepID=UPI003CFF894F